MSSTPNDRLDTQPELERVDPWADIGHGPPPPADRPPPPPRRPRPPRVRLEEWLATTRGFRR